MVDLKELVRCGVQFGHQTWRWSPRMAKYIWGQKDGVHLIDVSKTAQQIERSAQFLESVAAEGKQILWVGTKKAARGIIGDIGTRLNCPHVNNRWVGGTLTNFSQVKKSVTKLLHLEDVLQKFDKYTYTKKEYGVFQKLVDRLQYNIGGIKSLNFPVGALVVVDATKEATAIKEAIAMNIPIVCLVDTNGDPSGISYVIPGNDDIARSIKIIFDELVTAVERGTAAARERKTNEAVAAQASESVAVASGDLLSEEEGSAARGPRKAPAGNAAPRARTQSSRPRPPKAPEQQKEQAPVAEEKAAEKASE